MILKLQRHSDMSEASAVLILRERVVLKGKLHAMVSKPFTIVHMHAYQIFLFAIIIIIIIRDY